MYKIRLTVIWALVLFMSVKTYANEPNRIADNKPDEPHKTVEVGYGVRQEEAFTGSVSTINADQIDRSPEINISRIMKGRLTGTTILNGGDEPGYASMSLFIRGCGTYGQGREPLIMIDGIEGSLSQLHPEEIESITVLKDAAVLALYGIRAANGAIQVKTKRGGEGKIAISIKAQTAMLSPTVMPRYLGSEEYLRYRNAALANDGLIIPSDPRLNPDMYNGQNDPFLYPNTDWYGAMLRNQSLQQNYTASIRGGSSRVRYYVFAGVTSQSGLYKESDLSFTGINLRSNLDMNITRNLSIKMDLAGRIELRKTPMSSADKIFSVLSTFPSFFLLVNRNGSLAGTAEYSNNPLGLISRTGSGDQNSRYLIGNVRANYDLSDLTKGLSVYAQYSFNTYKHFGRKKSQSFALYRENLDGTYSQFGQDTDLSLAYEQMNDDYALFMSFMGGFNYQRKIDKHQFDASVNLLFSSKEFTGNNPNNKQLNYFGHLSYGFDRRYFVELGASYSGSEDFIGKNRFGFFPTLSAAWNITNESFMESVRWIDRLKLRGSYGILGNSNVGIGRFPSDPRYYKGGGYYFGGSTTESDGAFEGSISNPNITFERSYNANIGLDFSLLKDRLYGSLDLFHQKRMDIITQRTGTKPAIIGQVLPFENFGEVTNRGVEAMLGYKDMVGEVTFFVEANLSFARSRIDHYDEVAGINEWERRIGQSVFQQWGHEALGIFQTEAEVSSWANSIYATLYPGDLKYNDLNKDGRIDEADEKPIGMPSVPELNAGLSLGIEYKGFDFSILFSGVANRSVYVNNNVLWGGSKMTASVREAWQAGVNESNAVYPRLTTLVNNHNYRSNTLWMMNADYIRLQNVELGYTFPDRWTERIKIAQLRLFVNGSNLFSFDHLRKYGLNAENPNLGVTSYPQMSVANVGLSLLF